MKKVVLSGAVCALLLAGCADKINDGQPIAVKANTPTNVATMVAMTRGCDYVAPPKSTVLIPPKSGKVDFSIGKFPYWEKGHPCEGVPMVGTFGRYTPDKGFKGNDSFTIKFDYDSNDGGGRATRSAVFNVLVQ